MDKSASSKNKWYAFGSPDPTLSRKRKGISKLIDNLDPRSKLKNSPSLVAFLKAYLSYSYKDR